MSPSLLVLCICPTGIDSQSGLPLRPCCHLVGRLVRFLLGIRGNEPIVTIPVRANVGGDGVSDGVETIGDKGPIIPVRLDEVLQELVIVWCPKLVGYTRLLCALWIGGGRSNDEIAVTVSLEQACIRHSKSPPGNMST